MQRRGRLSQSVARDRPNLRVLTDTLVLRLLFEGRRTIGVSVHRYGQEETLFAGMTNRTPARDRPGALGWRRGSDKAERRLDLIATRWDYPPARGWCRRPLSMMRS
jgi:hypothetical protein